MLILLFVLGCAIAITVVAVANRRRELIGSAARRESGPADGRNAGWVFTGGESGTVDCGGSDGGGGCDGGT